MTARFVGFSTVLLLAAPRMAAAGRTWANPIDIDYPYSFEQLNEGLSYRTGADPAIVRFDGAYYLFATLADGYWMSTDLVHWVFIKADRWPLTNPVAPATLVSDGKLFMAQSAMEPQALLFSVDPAHGHWNFWTRLLPRIPNASAYANAMLMKPGELPSGPWDPALFQDRDGTTYLYWGSSNLFPLYGAKLDMQLDEVNAGEARRLRFVGEPVALMKLVPTEHGWERFGRDHTAEAVRPFLEGAWMNRRGDRYYLQYGAPGTEQNVYATGVYVGNGPLGPFTYAPYNPVGYKPGGFVTGAGHGSTFEDVYGNVWNAGTAWVGVNWPFERRIGLFPAGFHDDGQMWVDTRFADFPQRMPERGLTRGESTFTGWMLLSYRKNVRASSAVAGHVASSAADENPRTFWVAARNAPGETLTIDLGGMRAVRAVQVNFADFDSGRYGGASDIYTQFALEGSADGKQWRTLADLSRETVDRPNAYVELQEGVRARYIRYVHGHVGAKTLAIADMRVFGTADGAPPVAPVLISARRQPDARNADIVWKPVAGAVGYNIRWGVAADRLHSTYQRFADQPTSLELRALTKGVKYTVAVEAFDENGVSPLSRTIIIEP